MRIIACLLGLLWAGAAHAQPQGIVTVAPGLNGFGSLAVTNSSAAISTMTLGLNSSTFVLPLNGMLSILNAKSSAGNIYVCLKGGSCTTSGSNAGIPIIPGQQMYNINLGGSTTSPTVIADTTATIWITW